MKEFNAYESNNKEATEYFIKFFGVYLYIEKLHPYVNYDSVFIKPLFALQEYYFEKGKSLLPKNSSEDVFWWVAVYRHIYGLNVNTELRDQTLDPVLNLSPKAYEQLNKKVFAMLIRYLNLDNDFNAHIPEVNKYKLLMVNDLLNHYYRMFHHQYVKGFKGKSQAHQKFTNPQLLNDMKRLYALYNNYVKHYSNDTFNEKKTYVSINATRVMLISDIYYSRQYQLETRKISNKVCHSKQTKILLQSIKNLYPYRDVKYKTLRESIFKYWIIEAVVVRIYNSCNNLKEESKEVIKLMQGVYNGK